MRVTRSANNKFIPCNDDACVCDVFLVTDCLLLRRLLIMLEIFPKRFVRELNVWTAIRLRLMNALIIRRRQAGVGRVLA